MSQLTAKISVGSADAGSESRPEEHEYEPYKAVAVTGERMPQVWDEHGRGLLEAGYANKHGIRPGIRGPALTALCWQIQNLGRHCYFPEQFKRMFAAAVREELPEIMTAEWDERIQFAREAYAEMKKAMQSQIDALKAEIAELKKERRY